MAIIHSKDYGNAIFMSVQIVCHWNRSTKKKTLYLINERKKIQNVQFITTIHVGTPYFFVSINRSNDDKPMGILN